MTIKASVWSRITYEYMIALDMVLHDMTYYFVFDNKDIIRIRRIKCYSVFRNY